MGILVDNLIKSILSEHEATIKSLEILDSSGFEFNLTGSRFFGNSRQDSDWDFFAQDFPEIREFLAKHKFVLLSLDSEKFANIYGDQNTATVFCGLGGVHVQLVKDVSAKKWAQNLLAEWGLLDLVSKKDARFLWDLAYFLMHLTG